MSTTDQNVLNALQKLEKENAIFCKDVLKYSRIKDVIICLSLLTTTVCIGLLITKK